MAISFPQSGAKKSANTRPANRVAALLGLAFAALTLVGCSGGPGSREDFIEVLRRNDNFNETEAGCIANAVFDQYENVDGAIDKISGAESWDWVTGVDGVDGFGDAYETIVEGCTSVGPSIDG